MLKTFLLIPAFIVLAISAPALRPPVGASASDRFFAFAVSAQPLRFTPKSQKLITSEPVTGGITITAARVHTGRWEWNPQAIMKIHNGDPAQSVKHIEFSAVIYNNARRTQVERQSLSKGATISPGKSEEVELVIIARLPSDNLVLLQLTRVTFTDGTSWAADVEYALNEDMSGIERKQ